MKTDEILQIDVPTMDTMDDGQRHELAIAEVRKIRRSLIAVRRLTEREIASLGDNFPFVMDMAEHELDDCFEALIPSLDRE